MEIFELKICFFGLHLVRLIHTGINSSCPSRIHINKLLVPLPKVISAPPPTLYSRPDCDGLKLGGRVGARFYAEFPNNPKQAFLHLGIYSTGFQAEVLAISEVAKNLLLEKCTIKLLLRWVIVKQLSKH